MLVGSPTMQARGLMFASRMSAMSSFTPKQPISTSSVGQFHGGIADNVVPRDAEFRYGAKKNLILAVKTGLTGLAQVSGRRDISFEERRKLDLYYVQNWSFWMDIVILVKTVRVVLGGRGTNS